MLVWMEWDNKATVVGIMILSGLPHTRLSISHSAITSLAVRGGRKLGLLTGM